eukprot:1376719-Amorphochlora_amoeboformis.AAC.1
MTSEHKLQVLRVSLSSLFRLSPLTLLASLSLCFASSFPEYVTSQSKSIESGSWRKYDHSRGEEEER